MISSACLSSLVYLDVWLFRCFILSHFNYCALAWHFCEITKTKKLEKVQCRALQFVFQDFSSTYQALLKRAGLPTLKRAREKMIVVEVFKSVHHLSPKVMWGMFQPKSTPYKLRTKNNLQIPPPRAVKYGQRTLSVHRAVLWNSLSSSASACNNLNTFKTLFERWN